MSHLDPGDDGGSYEILQKWTPVGKKWREREREKSGCGGCLEK